MLKYIQDFEGVTKRLQAKKVCEEALEFTEEIDKGSIEEADQEGADVIQTVLTFWMNRGYGIEEIEDIFKKHYEKETLRGRKVIDIRGTNAQNGVIKGLLKRIIQLEKEIRLLRMQNIED